MTYVIVGIICLLVGFFVGFRAAIWTLVEMAKDGKSPNLKEALIEAVKK